MRFGNEVAEVLKIMRDEKRFYKNYLPIEAINAGKKMMGKIEGLWEDVRESIFQLVKSEIPCESPYEAVWWYSILLGIVKDPSVFYDFTRYLRSHSHAFSVNTQCFLYYQLNGLLFLYPELNCEKNKLELWYFYKEMLEGFVGNMQLPIGEIPPEERNGNLIIVVTEQFLGVAHGPTKTALDRCKVLMEKIGKEVILINSMEMLNGIGKIPFYRMRLGNHDERKGMEEFQLWKGSKIPYYQCRNQMPELEGLRHMLKVIRQMAPSWVVLIGGGGILGNLLGRMVPAIAIGTIPSELSINCTKYETLGRKLTKMDLDMLEKLDYTENNIIESVFSSSLKPQEEQITREMAGIPEKTFLIVVVGVRLNNEVTKVFLEMLEKVLKENMQVGFLGEFSKYEEKISMFPVLKEKSFCFGFCDDILSRLEICDLYVNPIRKGGGTSCVEAMFKGLPVVTVDYGDVSVNAGKEFCVKDYREMQDKILKYYEDKEYYKEMSKKAEARTKILLDTEAEFVRIMEEAERRESMMNKKEVQDAGI